MCIMKQNTHLNHLQATSILNLRALKQLQEDIDSDAPENESTEINNNKTSGPRKQPPTPADR